MDGIIDNLQNALQTWNKKLSEIWLLLTQSIENFKGGGIWEVIVKIYGALLAIDLALLILFFVLGVVKSCTNLAEVNFHLRTRADTPLLRTEYQICNKHLLLTEKSG